MVVSLRSLAVLLLITFATSTLEAQQDRASLLTREKKLREKFEELVREHSFEDDRVLRTLDEHADVLFLLTDYKEALKRYEKLQKAQFRALSKDSETHVHTGLNIAKCHAGMGKDRKAKSTIKTLKKYCRKNYERAKKLSMFETIAIELHGMYLYEESAETYKEVLDNYEDTYGSEDLKTLSAAIGYTASLIELDRGEEIEKVATDALEIFEKHHPDSSGNLYLRNNISYYYVRKQRFKEAHATLAPVIGRLADQTNLAFDFKLIMRENHVIALAAIDREAEALPLIEELIKDLKKNPLRNRGKIASMEELRDECKGLTEESPTPAPGKPPEAEGTGS